VSFLEEKGTPMVVQKTLILPPHAHIGPCEPSLRSQALASSPVAGKYDQLLDRESAYEKLKAQIAKEPEVLPAPMPEQPQYEAPRPEPRYEAPRYEEPRAPKQPTRRTDSMVESVTKSVLRAAGSQLGRQLVRGILGGLFGSSRRR
jgi:hypothetical protein